MPGYYQTIHRCSRVSDSELTGSWLLEQTPSCKLALGNKFDQSQPQANNGRTET